MELEIKKGKCGFCLKEGVDTQPIQNKVYTMNICWFCGEEEVNRRFLQDRGFTSIPTKIEDYRKMWGVKKGEEPKKEE